MATGIYVGVNGVAQKVKKAYVGVNGVAQKVKKAYAGVGGVAKLVYVSEKKLVKVSPNPDDLSNVRHSLAATTIGDYALFGGGSNPSTANVDVYNNNLIHSRPAYDLKTARGHLSAASTDNIAMFFYGVDYNNNFCKAIEKYDNNLTRSDMSSYRGYADGSAASTKDRITFGGGYYLDSNSNKVLNFSASTYDINGSYSRSSDLSEGKYALASTSINEYIIFAGGRIAGSGGSVYKKTSDAFNSNNTRTILTDLQSSREGLAATTIGNYALFAGGYNQSLVSYVDVYNQNLTHSLTTDNLTASRYYLNAANTKNYAIFAGGYSWNLTKVDAYDVNLTHSLLSELDPGRGRMGATSVGDYALFAGGVGSSTYKTVEAYTEE